MVDLFGRRKKAVESEGPKPWEKTEGWSNPFASEDAAALEEERRKERRRRKEKRIKKRVMRRLNLTEEEYSEMSSKADNLLDDLLDDDQASTSPAVNGQYKNPFDDEEEDETSAGQEIDEEAYAAMMGASSKENVHLVPIVTSEQVPELQDDDSILPPPPTNKFEEDRERSDQTISTNPFEEDETVYESVNESTAYEVESTVAPSLQEAVDKRSPSAQLEDLKRQPTESTEEPGESECSTSSEGEQAQDEEEVEEEDVVESSKRLLRMVDDRMRYQQYADEIKALRGTIASMRKQAEAMSEQLRRAVETKCDLVLAQTELERSHEQHLIVKDNEIRDMKHYVQGLLDQQAEDELNFMNEISALSMQLQGEKTRHEKEMQEKNLQIGRLQAQLRSAQIAETSPEAFRSRFIDASSSIFGLGGSISVQ